jgi:RNA polymerase sigma factor (sigma-70 family)
MNNQETGTPPSGQPPFEVGTPSPRRVQILTPEEEVEALKLSLIKEYDSIVPVIATLAGVGNDEAREAVHTVICRVLVGVNRRPAGDPVVAWRPYIIQSAMNALKEEARRVASRRETVHLFGELDPEQRREIRELLTHEAGPAEKAEQQELLARAQEELAQLPPRQREVIKRRNDKETFGEIAGAMGISVGAVKKLYNVGMKQLRRRFFGWHGAGEAHKANIPLLRLIQGAA